MAESTYRTAEQEALGEQVQRGVAKEVVPFGELWDERGFVPVALDAVAKRFAGA